LDLNEQSRICAQSLLARSKPLPARTWSLKWKRDSWTQHLSGRILKPSLGQSFVERWTSSLADTLANHSQPPENASAPKTLDTCGPSSQMELDSCSPDFVSLRTSKDTSALDSERSLKNWEALVTKRRGAYSARVKLALRTKESGSSSWPTSSTRDYKGGYVGGRIRNGKISMDTLDVAVQAVEAGWPTPTVQEAGKIGNKANYGQLGLSNHPAIVGIPNRPKGIKDGLAVPENLNTNGNRQGLWPTATVVNRVRNEETLAKCAKFRKLNANQNTVPLYLEEKVLIEEKKAWATPKASDPQHSGPNMRDSAGNYALPAQAVRTSLATGKLNPRWVETLMGLPVGWTMPSCQSPVTIEQTNSDSSVTESSQIPQPELF
jgi:hypothetical protein